MKLEIPFNQDLIEKIFNDDPYFIREINAIKRNESDTFKFFERKFYFCQIDPYIKALEENYSVINFIIDFTNIYQSRVSSVFDFLKDRKHIKEINLFNINVYDRSRTNQQEIHSIAFELFAKSLSDGLCVKELSFILSIIKSEGAQILVANLVNNNFLSTLNLNGNRIGDDGVEMILKSLTPSKVIKKISLSSNDLTDKSTHYLEQFLGDNHSIKKLDLSNNNITMIGFEQLNKGLLVNQSLTGLQLRGNIISSKDADFQQLNNYAEICIRINSYITKILSKQEDSNNISEEKKYALNVELEHALKLKEYLNKAKLTSFIQDFDDKVKFYALDITPTPLEIILKTNKFLDVMNLYLSKSVGQTYADQNEAVLATIDQISLPHSLYSFYQFIETAESLEKIILTEEEREAIKVYQKNPNYIKDFMISARNELAEKAAAEYMAKHFEEAIKIQQLEDIFHYILPNAFIHNINEAFNEYFVAGGFAINKSHGCDFNAH